WLFFFWASLFIFSFISERLGRISFRFILSYSLNVSSLKSAKNDLLFEPIISPLKAICKFETAPVFIDILLVAEETGC
ncbi:MAG: hypothetical protein J7L26_03890, partial [Candidatus Aminicenantes bacterium]|nr:hypothetical protein [Candidatus Aminicenantes bacterium]